MLDKISVKRTNGRQLSSDCRFFVFFIQKAQIAPDHQTVDLIGFEMIHMVWILLRKEVIIDKRRKFFEIVQIGPTGIRGIPLFG